MASDTCATWKAAEAAGCGWSPGAPPHGHRQDPRCARCAPGCQDRWSMPTWAPWPKYLLRRMNWARCRPSGPVMVLAALRSALFVAWMAGDGGARLAVLRCRWSGEATAVLDVCLWLRVVIHGAGHLRVRWRIRGMEHLLTRADATLGRGAGQQAPVDLGGVRLPGPDVAPAVLRVQARVAVHPVLRWAGVGWT